MLSIVRSAAFEDLFARIQAAARRFPDTYLIAAKADVPTWPATYDHNDPVYANLGLGIGQEQSLLRAVLSDTWEAPRRRFVSIFWFKHEEEKFQAFLFDYAGKYTKKGSAAHSESIKEFRRLADEAAGYFPDLPQLKPQPGVPFCNDPPGPWLAVMMATLQINRRSFRLNPTTGRYSDVDLWGGNFSQPHFTILQPPPGNVFNLMLRTLEGLNGNASFPPNASAAAPKSYVALAPAVLGQSAENIVSGAVETAEVSATNNTALALHSGFIAGKQAQPAPANDAPKGEGEKPGATAICSLGERQYRIGSGIPVAVTEHEDCVLQAFIEQACMDTQALIERSGVTRAVRILSELANKYGGAFAPAIRRPGGKGKGGYYVNIHRAGNKLAE